MIKRIALVAFVLLMGGSSAFDAAAAAKKTDAGNNQTSLIDLNTATVDQLNALPAVGSVRAAAIIAARPYKSVADLLAKGVVPQGTFDKIKNLVTVSVSTSSTKTAPAAPVPDVATTPPEPRDVVDINAATVEELKALPGIGEVRASAIIAGRPYTAVDQLVSRHVLSQGVLDELKGKIEVTPSTLGSGRTLTPGQLAEQKRIRICGAEWRADKAAGKIPAGQTWPVFWSDCDKRLKKQGL